jgi:hypothetical protein
MKTEPKRVFARTGLLALLAVAGLAAFPPGARADPVIVAAGDICGSPTDCRPTSRLIGRVDPKRVLPLGDNAYDAGTLEQYQAYYAPNWGHFKGKTNPVPGNHEYDSGDSSGYFDYFGSRARAPYYSYDLGAWHLIALNGELDVSTDSPQERWLKHDLAAHPSRCVLAYWHEPRFTSGSEHYSDTDFVPFWKDLYAARADVVLNGHVHNYERFARQKPSGKAARNGIREFVVGTGGASHYPSGPPIRHSQVQNDTAFGVLKLNLHRSSYTWKFVPVASKRFTDSGRSTCSRARATPARAAGARAAAGGGDPPRRRYVYFSSSNPKGTVKNGWNLLDVGSVSSADALPRGAKGLVWVGDYDNDNCSWEQTDAQVRSEVEKAVGDRKVYGFFISDEPNPYECPSAPADHRTRSELIHSIDPSKRTVIVLDSNGFGQTPTDSLDQLPDWKGTADFIGLDPYPCYRGERCDFSWVTKTIRRATGAGLSYWGVAQAFDGDSWRWPTPAEEARLLTLWARSRQQGYMTFAWDWSGSLLPSRPKLLRVLRLYNKGVAPNTRIVDGPPSRTTSRRATFRFGSSIPGSRFSCSLDGGARRKCRSPSEYTGLSRGSHMFRVRASVFARTDSSPAKFTWTIR